MFVCSPVFSGGLLACLAAACKSQLNQPFTILEIRWKSTPDPNIAIPLFKSNFLMHPN